MGGQEAAHAQEDVARAVARPLDEPLRGRKRTGDVSAPPRVGQVEGRDLRSGRKELRHFALADSLAVGPGRQLVDLGRQLVRAVSHEIDYRPSRYGLPKHAPLAQLAL